MKIGETPGGGFVKNGDTPGGGGFTGKGHSPGGG